MTDPERDLAAKVREALDSIPREHLVEDESETVEKHTMVRTYKHFTGEAALESLLALTVKYREALENIVASHEHGGECYSNPMDPTEPYCHLPTPSARAIAVAALAHDEGVTYLAGVTARLAEQAYIPDPEAFRAHDEGSPE